MGLVVVPVCGGHEFSPIRRILRVPAERTDLRNVAIVAHIDHGKTTMLDAMLRQSGAFRANQQVAERVMDSMDLEREKGITILAKHTSVRYGDVQVKLVDTPGHADFGGEVERSLRMVDAALLLVDASEGPLPQTRYVLGKVLGMRLPVIVCVNKVDRSDARPAEVVREIEELFLELALELGLSDEDRFWSDFPVLFANARAGCAGPSPDDLASDLGPLFEAILKTTPPPSHTPGHPLQFLVTNLDADPYVGRLAIGRLWQGTVHTGDHVAVAKRDGTVEHARVTKLLGSVGLATVELESASAGEIVGIAGLGDVTVGETVTATDDPRPLGVVAVDEPSLTMEFGVNTSPLGGREGTFLTARHLRDRLAREVLGNVSLRVAAGSPTGGAETFEVQGRGELQLAILVEQMRREGFELQVSKPEVITRVVDGQVHEPFEAVTLDIPEDFVGVVTQTLSQRRGQMQDMTNHGSGWLRMRWRVPARGLIGFRPQLLTETRGTAILHHVLDGYGPWAGEITHRQGGALVADRAGVTTPYALDALHLRGTLFVEPGVEVYEGMVIGENPRPDDIDVNPTKARQKTNFRDAAGLTGERGKLAPPRTFSLEQALEYITADELVEVTPSTIRMRKRVLDAAVRGRVAKRAKQRG
jgi:GTP-binding protein